MSVNAILVFQTLCALLRAIFQKRLSDRSFDVIDIIVGFDSAECQMRVSPQRAVMQLPLPLLVTGVLNNLQNLIESLSKFLAEDYPGMTSLTPPCLSGKVWH